jgi:hypothetical protein
VVQAWSKRVGQLGRNGRVSELLEHLAGAREGWLEVEQRALELHDPEAIEHATIAALAMGHLAERAAELDEPDEPDLADDLEREIYGAAG